MDMCAIPKKLALLQAAQPVLVGVLGEGTAFSAVRVRKALSSTGTILYLMLYLRTHSPMPLLEKTMSSLLHFI